MTTLHLCIATGQNAANFIPLKQLQAQEIWILETPEMQKQQSAKALTMALKSALPEAQLRTLAFDDSTPASMQAAALQLACDQLDGRDVLRTIAFFRFINPEANIRLAAGRKLLPENGATALLHGASASITGNMLTTSGSTIAEDMVMLQRLGLTNS